MLARLFVVSFCLLLAYPAGAQSSAEPDIGRATGRILGAFHVSGVLESWERSLRGTKESVTAEVVLSLRTDSTGSVEYTELVSARQVNAEVQRQMVAAVEPLMLPGLRSYDGRISFTLHYEPTPTLSPVMRGVLAGVTVGLTALFVTLLE